MSDKKTFYIRLGATTMAVILVMVVAKLLFGNSGEFLGAGHQMISWQDAANHYGEICSVRGTVAITRNDGEICLLNFHPDWKKHFTAVIFRENFGAFPPNPERYYLKRRVLVTGRIKRYRNKPEIILKSPDQIKIIE
ncbi:MAG: hypothetical protein K8S55_07015 [Phycisphaerae bacterium]|nr:hypothetical protein [Phycisphaerae bacterium]